jgi:transcriptional regulator
MGDRSEKPGELLQGTLDLLILKTLARSGEMHGYAIAEAIHTRSDKVLWVEEGALYPALHRLQVAGLLAGKWGLSENNRRAKYYRLTAKGHKRLDQAVESWRRARSAVDRIIEAVSD